MGSVITNPFAKTTQPPTQPLPTKVTNPSGSINNLEGNPNPNPDPDPTKIKASDDPLMDFKTLWEDEPVDPKNPPKPEETTFLPNIDPAKLQESFGKIDFSKYASPEEITAMTAGGDGAVKAHMSVLNKSLRQAMLTMFTASQRMTETGLTKAQERFLGRVPSHVKNILVEGNLTKSSKLMSNPAYSPMIEAVRQRFQDKFPRATADQISGAVDRYMQDFVTEATKKDETETPDNAQKLQKGDSSADWEAWIDPELRKSL